MRFRFDLLRQARERHKLTRRELSLRSGVSENAIYKLEAGMRDAPSTKVLMALAGVLGSDPMAFFDHGTHHGNSSPAA